MGKALQRYQIIDLRTKRVVESFADKMAAKRQRQELNGAAAELLYIVVPGPDHKKYKSPTKE